MAINPPSDIVLGVANAADPQKLRAAAAQLALAQGNTAGAANAGPAGASGDAEGASFASAAPKAQPVFAPQTNGTATPVQRGATKRTPDAYTKFEAFLVQTFVESMLPQDAPDVYGSGIAGKIWKSMLAEHLANEMAKSTSFGIAERIAKHREGARPDKPGAVNPAGASASIANPSAVPEAATPTRRGLG